MEIIKYEVSNDLINVLVEKFFISEEINQKRKIKNVENYFNYLERKDVFLKPELKDLTIKINYNFQLPIELVNTIKFDSNNLDYISLISNNCLNELQLYIVSIKFSDLNYDNIYNYVDINLEDDLIIKTKWYQIIDNKYSFIN